MELSGLEFTRLSEILGGIVKCRNDLAFLDSKHRRFADLMFAIPPSIGDVRCPSITRHSQRVTMVITRLNCFILALDRMIRFHEATATSFH